MPRYDYVLLDADNTLFDFDLAEHKALGLTLAGHGIPFTPEAEQTYIDINTALWSKFDRGEISQGALVVERFSSFLRAVGRAGDPAELNRYYLSRLGEQGDLLPGAEALAGPWPPAAPWPSSPTASLRPSGAALPAVRFRTAFPTFLFLRTLDSRSPGGSFSTLCSTIWAFPTRAALWWWVTPWAPTSWEPRTPAWTPSGITPRAAPPVPICPRC